MSVSSSAADASTSGGGGGGGAGSARAVNQAPPTAPQPLDKEILVTIPIGDASGDGHREFFTFNLLTNYHGRDIGRAYTRSCGVLGFSLHGRSGWWQDYQDNIITAEQLTKMKEVGLDVTRLPYFPDNPDDEEAMTNFLEDCMPPKGVLEVLLMMAKTQLPKLTWRAAPQESLGLYHNFGYGVTGS